MPIPQECARVQIIKVVDDKYLTCEIDYPNEEEGIETLEDAINQFVLWPRREIIIHTILDSPQPHEEDVDRGFSNKEPLPPSPQYSLPHEEGGRFMSTPPHERHDKVACVIQSSSTPPQQAQGEVRNRLIEPVPPPPPG